SGGGVPTGVRECFSHAGVGSAAPPPPRRYPSEELDRSRTLPRVFVNRHQSYGPFGQSQRGGLVTKARIAQREISDQLKIFRLFFEKRLQFAARLSPTFLGGGMISADFLCPA